MLKLYKRVGAELLYWEAWDNDDGKSATVHWGKVGERGETRNVASRIFSNFRKLVQREINKLEGYSEIVNEVTLIVEYEIDGWGTDADLKKRHALEDRMQETLGWTGLGTCDGGSIGSGTMEVCCFVVDFQIAKRVIEADIGDTEFGDYTKIYEEEAE